MVKFDCATFKIWSIAACASKISKEGTRKETLLSGSSDKQPPNKEQPKEVSTSTTPQPTSSDAVSGDANKSTSGAMSTFIPQFALLTIGIFLIK